MTLHYNADNNDSLANGKCIFKFKAVIKMLALQLNFVSEVYPINLELLSPEKCHLMEMCMIFQSIIILLTNLTYQTFTSI